jgi:putative ABC transport system ATP-binding protein
MIKKPVTDKPIVKAEKLSVIYFLGRPNQVNAVTDANLEIFPGEFIIFFGPSGCGKSTLLYSIAGLERNIQGNVFINGANLAKFNNKELDNHRQHTIGMIFQAYYLISSLSVFNNIVLPQFSLNTRNKDREAKADELLKFFGVGEQKDKYPNELSGGQQQRIAICRSLINEPDLILADEPTGNLDSKSATDVMNLLSELNEKKGKTVILVTHSPGSLDYAHRVFHMKDGRIIEMTVNRKRGEPVSKTVLKENILAKDLDVKAGKPKPAGAKSAESAVLGRGDFLVSVKAREIVAEVLTGLSVEEIGHIEAIVAKMIAGTAKGGSYNLLEYLDADSVEHGLGLNYATASKLTERIKKVIREINNLREKEAKFKSQFYHDYDPEITSIRHHIFEYFDIRLSQHRAVVNFDDIIKDRLAGFIDVNEVRVRLNQPLEEGGVGLDRRVVDKISKRIELLILGKM